MEPNSLLEFGLYCVLIGFVSAAFLRLTFGTLDAYRIIKSSQGREFF